MIMKQLPLVLCTLLLIPFHVMGQGVGRGPTAQQHPQTWKRYTVKGDEFSVTLPTLPAMTTVKTLQMRVQKHRRERQLRTTLDNVVYTIDVFENPEPRQSLEEFIAEQNANAAYDLTTERVVTINGFAGKQYLAQNKTPLTTVQFFATEKRLIRFSARGDAENPGVKQFFSSIVLGKKTEGIKVSDGPGNPLELETGRIFTAKEIDTKVRLLKKPEPTFTDRARAEQITGTVVLRAVFSATGEVTNIRVVQGLHGGLTERAIDVARKIKFVPAMKDGKFVSMWLQLEYNFNLY